MDKKEMSFMLVVTVFVLFLTGCLVGIALNLTGYTHINISSWRYWLGFSSFLIPMAVSIILRRYNINPTSIFGRLIFFYSTCITGIVITTCILDHPLEWWPTLVYMTVFSIIYPILLFVLEHPSVTSKVESVKSKFSRK
jgi:hypothetical protein